MKHLKSIFENTQPSYEEEMESISSVIRKMAKSQGYSESTVSLGDDHILVEIVLNKEETFNRILNMLNFIEKINRDILIDFKCDMDLWENKKGNPIFTFEFYQSSVGPTYDYNFEDDFPF